ncbi:YggN family protein [Shewanella waksmanii]|uniref:YggN family protein n=1 Tax=Shewanella waksmanii TaxID=213783 RepID=UPI0004ACF7AD|nr:YggN family protein [Shewanella waksmanii]
MKKLAASVGITAMVLATTASAWAHDGEGNHISFGDNKQCDVALNYDVAVEPKKLTVSDGGKEVYRVEFGKLFVEGKEIALNSSQQALVNDYSEQVSKQVPEVIELVNDAVEIATSAVSMALTPLLGDASGAKIDTMMDGLSERIESVAYQNGDKFYIGATESSLEQTFGEDFEKELDQLVQSSIGSMMMTLGSEMMAGDGDTFEEKMNSFGQRMERMGQDIEREMEQQAQDLEVRAERVCDNFEQLLVTENKLRAQVSSLKNYALIDTSNQPLRE